MKRFGPAKFQAGAKGWIEADLASMSSISRRRIMESFKLDFPLRRDGHVSFSFLTIQILYHAKSFPALGIWPLLCTSLQRIPLSSSVTIYSSTSLKVLNEIFQQRRCYSREL